MKRAMSNLSPEEIGRLALCFAPEGVLDPPVPFGGGHINDTYLFSPRGEKGVRYVLQRINKAAFPHPEDVMDNMLRVTQHLREQIVLRGGDPQRETLRLLRTQDGLFYAVDRNGDYWRSYSFVSDSISYDRSGDEGIFRESGRAFGRFLRMLDGFDAASLHETIERFHDTPHRFAALNEAVARDAAGRAQGVRDLIALALSYEPFSSTLVDALASGRLPLRVTHNDTKLNNVLLDERTGRALCVIDLDTVMPGLCAYDFGDAIRYGASTAAEDERDLSRVHLSLPLYRAYAEGYLSEVGGVLTDAELRSLPVGAKMMTLETGVRFLTDYLNGDVYFKVACPDHNLVRARTQFQLLGEMVAHWDEMVSLIDELASREKSGA